MTKTIFAHFVGVSSEEFHRGLGKKEKISSL